MKSYLLILAVLYFSLSYSQTLSINITEKKFGLDQIHLIIVSRLQNIDEYQDIGDYNEINIRFGDRNYRFISPPDNLSYTNSYVVEDMMSSDQFVLYFTPLPIISIETNNIIVDEPKVQAVFTYSDNEQTLSSNIGIEIRGGTSQSYPKKTYDIEFWDDEMGNLNVDMKFGQLREDDDWILDALYNEPLRLRSYTATKLWKQIQVPYYVNYEPKAKSGADVMYVEMFLNGVYNGLYNLSEPIDRKQLKIKKFNDNLRGELYKGYTWGASTFTSLPSYNNNSRVWGGYEFEYPKSSEITDWSLLYQFTNFVINSSESEFENDIWSRFEKDNFINYFLFLNLIRATDNTGKNIYLAKYNQGEPYFYIPWDLDGCFGTIWNGTNSNITDDILTNGFISRVIDRNPKNILIDIANKWFENKNHVFSYASLSEFVRQQYETLDNNKIYERESLVYSNYSFEIHDLNYTLDWIQNRLNFLDDYFLMMLSTIDVSITNKITFFPNPATDKIQVDSEVSLTDNFYKIFNASGQTVGSGYLINRQINIEKLEKGIYYVLLGNVSFKFIKK
tara:strand:- start:209 stop:1891 length:1683 start_codon:yes stop_codon:yes gene_type:complete